MYALRLRRPIAGIVLDYFHALRKRPNPTIPFPSTLQFGGFTHISPLLSTSRFKLGRTFEGGDCKDAGPAKAFPVRGSYILPWQGHSPLFLPGSGQYFHRHHRCRHTMLNILNADASLLLPPSSSGNRMNCHILNASLFKTGSSLLG